MTLVNMAMSTEEQLEYAGQTAPSAPNPDMMPKYPYGLCLSLDDDAMEKLGLDTSMRVGDEMMITARVRVTAVRDEERVSPESEMSCSLQITDMACEKTSKRTKRMADALYDKPKDE